MRISPWFIFVFSYFCAGFFFCFSCFWGSYRTFELWYPSGKWKKVIACLGSLSVFHHYMRREWGSGWGEAEAGAIHRSLSARQLRVVIVQLIRPKTGWRRCNWMHCIAASWHMFVSVSNGFPSSRSVSCSVSVSLVICQFVSWTCVLFAFATPSPPDRLPAHSHPTLIWKISVNN